jgi:polyisoprenoid-binding protein YceI
MNTKWNIDPAHTRANFTVRHMMISWASGEFDKISGTIDFDPQNPANTSVDVQIEAGSINTRDEQRDAHLKSPDFLNIEKYPYLTFKSKRVEILGENKARLTGDLTIRDITREVVLDVEYAGMVKSPWGTTSAGFTAATKINRKDWNLTWNVALETGGVLVGEMVNITIQLELVRQEAAESSAEAVAG